MLRTYLTVLWHFARMSAGPLLVVWAVIFGMEWWLIAALERTSAAVVGPMSALISPQLNEGHLGTFLLHFLAILMVWGARQGLYKPAYELMRGGSPPRTIRHVLSQALPAIPRALAAQVIIALAFFATAVLCLLCHVVAIGVIEVPLMVALGPMVYITVAHGTSLRDALLRSIEMWRRHGVLMLGVETALILITYGLRVWLLPEETGAGIAARLMEWRTLSVVGLMGYIGWVARTSLYLTLDDERDSCVSHILS